MFFDIPISADKFSNILRTTKAKIVHLMNFSKEDINVDSFILRLSGMLKYALSNMEGNLNIKRLSKALNVDEDTIECALNIFETSQMIDLNRKDEENYIISYLHPVEMSKIKNADMYSELEIQINNIKSFKDFYLNSSVEEIKSII